MQKVIKSDIGVVRSENQDKAAIFDNGEQFLMILCDGMGGHVGGSYASQITVDTFKTNFKDIIPEDQINLWFKNIINLSKKNMTNFAKQKKQLLDMGTTVTAAVICKTKIFVFNIGDSRTYIYNGLLHQITKDHNVRNYYIDKYNYSPEEAAKIVQAAALTYSLGPDKKTKIDTFILPIDINTQYVVLTSDGIHDYISKPTFENVLSSQNSLEKKAMKLIKEAIRGKSSDNLTVAIIDLEQYVRNN